MILYIHPAIAWCFHKLIETKNRTVDPMSIWIYVYQHKDNADLIEELGSKTKDILTQPDKVCAEVNSFLQKQEIDEEILSDKHFKRFVFWQIVMSPMYDTERGSDIIELARFLNQCFDLKVLTSLTG